MAGIQLGISENILLLPSVLEKLPSFVFVFAIAIVIVIAAAITIRLRQKNRFKRLLADKDSLADRLSCSNSRLKMTVSNHRARIRELNAHLQHNGSDIQRLNAQVEKLTQSNQRLTRELRIKEGDFREFQAKAAEKDLRVRMFTSVEVLEGFLITKRFKVFYWEELLVGGIPVGEKKLLKIDQYTKMDESQVCEVLSDLAAPLVLAGLDVETAHGLLPTLLL